MRTWRRSKGGLQWEVTAPGLWTLVALFLMAVAIVVGGVGAILVLADFAAWLLGVRR